MAIAKDRLLAKLAPHKQEHLLAFWNELNHAQRTALAQQVDAMDLDRVARLFQNRSRQEDSSQLAMRAQPPPAIRIGASDNPFSAAEAVACGEEALRAGHVGAALVAGGQGSRLGFEHPKGMYSIGPVSGASLFQILLEKILAASRRYGAEIPLYLMTSPATDAETRKYMEENQYFGLQADAVHIFCQGTMPAVDAETGKLLLARRDRLFEGPDGHGGMLGALERTGALDNMRQRGLRHLSYFQVDNPLASVCDPEFVGYHALAGSQYSLQVVAKQDPMEKVGNVVSVDGMVRVIEYSDLSEAAARQRTEDGSLKIWAGSIAVHVFGVDLLAQCAQQETSLPFHLAWKAVPYVDVDGKLANPTSPNAIKFERFIFDLLPHAEKTISVEVDPRKGFAPLKNASGAATDTPEIVQNSLMSLHRQWLRQVGAEVRDGIRVEISPLFALDTTQLATKIPAGTKISRDTYFV